MAISLRTSLLALLLASSLVPVAGLALLQANAIADAQEARAAGELQSDALAAALRADAAAAQGEDALVAAQQGVSGREVALVSADGSARNATGPFAWPAMRTAAGDALSGAATVADPAGEPVHATWARAPVADALVVLVGAPVAPRVVALPFVLLGVFVAGGVALLLAFLGARVIAPVHRLERASRRLARGEWSIDLPEEGPAEVRALAGAFDEMARALQDQRQQLDTLLADRTRALIDREGDLEALRFTLAHEFREPVRSLRWMADDLLERPLRPADREAVELLRRRIDDIDAVFRDLLRYQDVSRRPAPIDDVALDRVLDRAMDLVDGARVSREPLPTVRGNVDLLAAAFSEILRNAVQHARSPVVVAAERHGDDVTITFDDRGPGIPAARRDDALHLFHRLRRDTPGTGAGLAIARRAIERHDGTLALEDAPGGGARVVVRLPVDGPAPSAPLPEPPSKRTF